MRKFRIDYVEPQTGEWDWVTKEFEDTKSFTAEERAKDLGYTLADKGEFKVKEIK